VPVIGLAVRWWDAGEGSGVKMLNKIFLYTGSVVRVSARSSFIADLRNGGPPEWRTPGMADGNPAFTHGLPSQYGNVILLFLT